MAGIKPTPTALNTIEILQRFQALCNELGCALMVNNGEGRLAVQREDAAPVEAVVIAIAPGRLIYVKAEGWRK